MTSKFCGIFAALWITALVWSYCQLDHKVLVIYSALEKGR